MTERWLKRMEEESAPGVFGGPPQGSQNWEGDLFAFLGFSTLGTLEGVSFWFSFDTIHKGAAHCSVCFPLFVRSGCAMADAELARLGTLLELAEQVERAERRTRRVSMAAEAGGFGGGDAPKWVWRNVWMAPVFFVLFFFFVCVCVFLKGGQQTRRNKHYRGWGLVSCFWRVPVVFVVVARCFRGTLNRKTTT